ncbi:hypothetical protein [Robbsia andropogonis]|uniref:hypothetical protein n=1 Tax=Robbsia andropogonis TaxID=28092 RepID=UPI00209F4B6A|nr:hypothetical protein [Robbsia andropogonis]MCP1120489.1 hypothetical protein [Robbsia andropogonis]MCP1131270.1 hypothetical protein [Robbsia andropogonis]
MGDKERGTFSQILISRNADFISFREAMDKLIFYTEEQPAIIAAVLKREFNYQKDLMHLVGPERYPRKITDSSPIEALLDCTINENKVCAAPYTYSEPAADPNQFGWNRNGFIFNLDFAGLPNPESLSTSSHGGRPLEEGQASDAEQLWITPYIGRKKLSLLRGAAFLAGVDLNQPGHLSINEKTSIDEWKDALTDAIFHDEIEATSWASDRDNEQMLSHDDIRRWCASRGHAWPIPDPIPAPANNAELMQRLRAAETELAEAKQRLTLSEQAISDRDSLKTRLAASETDVRKLSESLTLLQAQLAEAKSDEATGKAKSTMLRLIAGLAMAGAELNVHDARLTGSKEVLEVLQLKGVTIDPKVFRNYLRDGAALISQGREIS